MTYFYKVFLELCAKADIKPSPAAQAIGLSNAAATGWKNDKMPSDHTLQKLADFFEVPVSVFYEQKNPTSTDGSGVYQKRGEMHERIDNLSDDEYEELKPALLRMLARREKPEE